LNFYTFARLYGNNILVRGWSELEGGSFYKKVPFKPTFFLPSKKPTEYKTLEVEYLSSI